VTRWLHAGDKIDLGNRVLRVIHTPGHSPDGICLYDPLRKLLWTGDLFYNSDLYAHLDGSSLTDYTATAAKLARLAPNKVRHILCSHNITMISSKWLTKMDQAFRAIRNGTAARYTDADGIRVFDFGYFRIDVRIADLPATP